MQQTRSSGSDDDAIALGEFVLGFPDQTAALSPVGPLFDSGSYLVFRRLVQDVDGFRNQAQTGAAQVNPPITPDLFAAKMVGRWPSGAALALNPDSDPGPGNAVNDFTYAADDADGHATPQWAHIRKVNPRDEEQPPPPADVRRHRMIRRGLPFSHNGEKGLHFLTIVADLDRQFEFVQRKWSDDSNFPNGAEASTGPGYGPPVDGRPGAGPDPISGHRVDNAPVGFVAAAGQPPQPIPLIHQFVRMTGGEYFFVPNVQALATMASPAPE